MPWWWKHAAAAIAVLAAGEALYLWASSSYTVMTALAGLALGGLVLGGLWLIAKSADAETKRRDNRPPD